MTTLHDRLFALVGHHRTDNVLRVVRYLSVKHLESGMRELEKSGLRID